jgi:hypothetical protein
LETYCQPIHRFPLFFLILILLLISPPLTPDFLVLGHSTFNCLPPLASLSLITPPTLSSRVGHWRTNPQIVAKKLFTTLFPIPLPPSPGGLESLGKRRKEFAAGEGPLRAEGAGATESLGSRVRADRSQTSRPPDSCLPFSPFPTCPPAHFLPFASSPHTAWRPPCLLLSPFNLQLSTNLPPR